MTNRPIPNGFLKEFSKRVQDRLAEINPFIRALRETQKQKQQQEKNSKEEAK